MAGVQLTELTAFAAVAEHRSFTKAAAQVGVALPTISQTIRSLEDRLGVRLFNRTTRSVALTEAGLRLLGEIQPILEDLAAALENVNSFRDKPMGSLRLAVDRSAHILLRAALLSPLIHPFLERYPDIQMEVAIDDALGDIVDGRFDAGIRIGHRIERDMTIVRLLDEFKIKVVAAPQYMEGRAPPSHPKDLHAYNCIQFRLSSDGSVSPWIFTRGEESIEVAVSGTLIVNDIELLLNAALLGAGVAALPEPLIRSHLAEGRLMALLPDWGRLMPGVFLYHPSRRQVPMALQVLIRFMQTWRKSAWSGAETPLAAAPLAAAPLDVRA